MPKNEVKSSKSTRKPLRDVSNGIKPSKSVKMKDPVDDDAAQDQNDALDRLLLVRSDISSLVHQIDELVVQALNVTSKKGRKEIESFTRVLSEIHSSLKVWAPRFQKALSSHSGGSDNLLGQPVANKTVPLAEEGTSDVVQSPEQTNLDSLVSPSPLVSWRAHCTAEGGRHLFMLTPLPRPKAFTSKLQGSSKWVVEKITSSITAGVPSVSAISGYTDDDNIEGLAVKSTPSEVANAVETKRESNLIPRFASPPKLSKLDCSALAMTPCLKMSPPKSCVLLEPISQLSLKTTRFRKSTPFPVGTKDLSGSQLSESSSSEVSEKLALRYPELFGIQPHKLGDRRKGVESSPDWLMSPPKTCILMEPPDVKHSTDATSIQQFPRAALVKGNNVQSCGNALDEELGGSLALIESTPMLKEPESTFRTGKHHPGENTLKKELWTRFEAATTHGTCADVSVLRETTQKGFLDRLDEASCDETSPESLR